MGTVARTKLNGIHGDELFHGYPPLVNVSDLTIQGNVFLQRNHCSRLIRQSQKKSAWEKFQNNPQSHVLFELRISIANIADNGPADTLALSGALLATGIVAAGQGTAPQFLISLLDIM